MSISTINHIKSQAKRLKKSNQNFTYCQCLDLVSQTLFGVRDFHELRKVLDANHEQSTAHSLPDLNEFRANDWPYFELASFEQNASY